MPIIDTRAIIVWNQGGVGLVNTTDLQVDDAISTQQVAAEVIRDAFVDHVLPNLNSGCSLLRVELGNDGDGGVAISGAPGEVNGNMLAILNSYNIVKQINGGRNGRWFLPGADESVVDGVGQVLASSVINLNTAFASVLADCAAAGVTIGVKDNLGTFRPAAALTARNFISYQSRRLDRARG